jgi:hypothetical protein
MILTLAWRLASALTGAITGFGLFWVCMAAWVKWRLLHDVTPCRGFTRKQHVPLPPWRLHP